jgi:hypothetical protein
MDWALENWFWILIFVFFIAIHLFGHGGHGGHGGHKNTNKNEKDEVQGRPTNTHSGEHQH